MSSKQGIKNDWIKIKEMSIETDEKKKKKELNITSSNKYKRIIDNEKIEIKNDRVKNESKFNFKVKLNFKKIKISKKIQINIFALLYNLLAFFFYYLSLEGCFKTQSECIPLLSTMFLARLLIYGMLFSLMMSIEIYLILNRIIYVYHAIYVIIFYIYIYQYDHGSKLDYHGLYNFGLTLIAIVIFSIIIGFIYLIIFLKRKKNIYYWAIFIFISGFIIIKIIIFSFSFKNSCKDWDKGLNSTRINNSPEEYNCDLIYPKKCLIYTLNDFFDVSFIIHKKCSINDKQEKEHNFFLKYLKIDKKLTSLSSMTHFGLPITVNNPNFSMKNPKDYFRVHNYLYRNTILMDLYNSNKTKYYNGISPPEVEIFYDKKTKIRSAKMHLIKNESLSKIRNEIANDPNRTKANNSLYDNVMVIYIDCISRQHFLRKMKKTSNFIEKFMKYDNDLGFNSYQFMKYQSFAHWTTPNVMPMFYSSKTNLGQPVNVIKYFKENGYITGNSVNLCSKESLEFDPEEKSNYNIILDEYDNENIAMFCDPNYSSEDSPYPLITGPYGILRKCLFGLDTFKYVLEFANQFWKMYPDNRKYLRLSFQDGHEPTGQVVKYLDEYLYNFLNDFYKKNLLNDTAIFILSDHGNSYFNYIYYYILKSDDSLRERTYGTLFMILPSNKNIYKDYYYNNIYKNQQTLISPFDIHDTLIHIIFGNNTFYNREVYSNNGDSLLSEFDGKSRNCSKWKRHMVDTECLCKQ